MHSDLKLCSPRSSMVKRAKLVSSCCPDVFGVRMSMHLLPRLGCDKTSIQFGLVHFDAYTNDALLIGSRHYR